MPLVETDPQSGRAYLKIPVPEPATVQRLADALLDYPEARESWFRFKGDFEMRQADAWCAEHDIEPVWRRKMGGG